MFVEYAKAGPDDILIRIDRRSIAVRRLPTAPAADCLVSQHLVLGSRQRRAQIHNARPYVGRSRRVIALDHHDYYGRTLALLRRRAELLFTENETNAQRLFGATIALAYVKDGINDYIVHGNARRGQSRRRRHQSRGALRPHDRAGRDA